MTQGSNQDSSPPGGTTTTLAHTTVPPSGPPKYPSPIDRPGRSPTDTIAAVTVAVLAVVIVLTLVLVCRALRKRRRSRRGTELTHIPTISTGIMGTGVAAYSHNQQVPVAGHITWEPVDAASSSFELSNQAPSTSQGAQSR